MQPARQVRLSLHGMHNVWLKKLQVYTLQEHNGSWAAGVDLNMQVFVHTSSLLLFCQGLL